MSFFDGVVVFFFAAEIGCAVGSLDAFAGIEHAPVFSVDKQMVKLTARGRLPYGELQVAIELITQKDGPFLVADMPLVVLERAQIDVIKFLRPFVSEKRVVQFRRAVGVSEKKAERMFRV